MAADYDGGNTTGFRSPAGDDLEQPIDLAELLDLRRPHRYVARVEGDLLRRGILQGDVLILDTSAPPKAGQVCVAFVHGDTLIAELVRTEAGWALRPAREGSAAIPLNGEEAELWGVVTSLVRPVV